MPSITDGLPWISALVIGAVSLVALGVALAAVLRRRAPADGLPPPRSVDPTSLPVDPDITAALDRRAVRRATGRSEGERG